MSILKIEDDAVFKIKFEKSEEFNKSFFRNSYKTAFKILNEIVSRNSKINEKENNLDYRDKKIDNQETNNIIIFTGERGSGKTSVMTSFVESLKEPESMGKLEYNDKSFDKYSYKVCSIVDPSIFNKNNSIVEIVVAELFREFKNNCRNDNFNEKKELIKAFDNVYRDIRIINKEKINLLEESEESLEILLSLSSATNLKANMYELVQLYLRYFKKNFLVVPIDDLDMKYEFGSSIIEDIRKYLILPNIVIIMAIKFDQLSDIITEENMKKVKDIYKVFELGDNLNSFRARADKYLEKIIPLNRRINLPVPNVFKSEFEININNKKENGKNLANGIELLIKEKLDFEMKIDEKNKYLIPNNLRGIIDLVKVLTDMDNIDSSDTLLINIDVFIEYIRNRFNSKSSYRNHCSILNEIIRFSYKHLNKRIIRYIGYYMKNQNIKNENINKYIEECMSPDVNENNLGIGYLNQMIELLDKYSIKENDKEFAFSLKIIYSLNMKKLLINNKISELKEIVAGDIYGEFYKLQDINSRYILNYNVDVEDGKSRKLILNVTDKLNSEEDKNIVESEEFKQLVAILTRRFKSENLDQYKYKKIYCKGALTEEPFVIGYKDKITLKHARYHFNPLNIINYYLYYDEICKERIGLEKFEENKYEKECKVLLESITNLDKLSRFIEEINNILYKNGKPLKRSRDDYEENFSWYIKLPIRYLIKDKNLIENLTGNIMTEFLINNITILEDVTPENRDKLKEKGYIGKYQEYKFEKEFYDLIDEYVRKLKEYLKDKIKNVTGGGISSYILNKNRELEGKIKNKKNITEIDKQYLIKKIDNIDKIKNKINKTKANTDERKRCINEMNSELDEFIKSIKVKEEN